MSKRQRPDVAGQANLQGDALILKRVKITPPVTNDIVNLTLPDEDGTLALTSQIVTPTGFVDLTTAQSVAGNKTFTDYMRITNQYGLNQTNLTSCSMYSNSFTLGLGGIRFDTAAQGVGSAVLTLPTIPSNVVVTLPSVSGTLLSTGAGFTIPLGDIVLSSGDIDMGGGNITLSSGRFISALGGTNGAPAVSINGNNGIYSSAGSSLSVTTGGIQRGTFSTSQLLLSNNYSVTCQGTAAVACGTGGHIGAGPFSSTLASQGPTNTSVRPSGFANTGIWGNVGGTNMHATIGGTNIATFTASGTQLAGTLSTSGVSTLTGGLKVSAVGSTIGGIVRGSTAIPPPGGAGNGVALTITHNLGVAPLYMTGIVNKLGVLPLSNDNFTVAVRSHSATQTVFEIWRVDLNSGWLNNYNLDWLVMS